MKEAFDLQFAATIERAEKQIILARYGRRLLNLLDDTPVVPGDVRQPFANVNEARQVLSDAEQELQQWQPNLEPIHSSGGLGNNLMPADDITTTASEAGESHVQSEVAQASQGIETHHDKPAAEHQGSHLSEAVAS